MKTARILVTQVAYDLGKAVFDVSSGDGLHFEAAPEEEAPLALRVKESEAFGVVVAGGKYRGPLYESVPRGGIIARFGVGHDGIDQTLARKHGIHLTNAPGSLDQSVAENTVFLLGALARSIPQYDRAMHNGVWVTGMGMELCGSTLSIIGLGRIGRKVTQIAAKGFKMNVVAYDVASLDAHRDFIQRLSAESKTKIHYTQSLAEALRAGQFCTLHAPLMETTKGIIGREELAMMPRGAFLINTARGAIVDEIALFDALDQGHLAGAALDAFTNEPYVPLDPAKDFRKLPNVIMTPHASSSTHAAIHKIAEMCVENVRALLESKHSDMTTY
jgi:phosphoglycerate dehydrogenase-like enzyme